MTEGEVRVIDPGRLSQTTGVEDVVANVLTRVALLLSGAGIQSLLAYALLPAGRGEYAVCILFARCLGVALTPGADAGSQYLVMSRRISVSQGVSASLLICLVGSVLATVLAVPLISSEFPFFRKADSQTFYTALCLIPLITFATAVQHQLAGLRRFIRVGFYSLLRSVTNVVTLACFVVGLGLGVEGAVLAACLSQLVMIVFCLRDLMKSAGCRFVTPVPLCVADILRYGMRYYIGRIGWGADVQVGIILLGVLGSRSEVGLFAVASTLAMSLITLSNSVSVALLPRTAAALGGRTELTLFCARTMTWLVICLMGVLIALDVRLVRILFSGEFVPLVPLMRIIAPGICVYAGASVFATYFRGTDRPEICSWAVVVGFSLTIIIFLILYKNVGLVAAAWGMAGGLVGRSMLLSFCFYRITNTRLAHGWFPQRGDAARFVAMVRVVLHRIRSASVRTAPRPHNAVARQRKRN